MHRTTERIPVWSLCYLMYGEASSLTDEEIGIIDTWIHNWQVQIVSPVTTEEGDLEPYFSSHPLFGLPSEVVDCDIMYISDNPLPMDRIAKGIIAGHDAPAG